MLCDCGHESEMPITFGGQTWCLECSVRLFERTSEDGYETDQLTRRLSEARGKQQCLQEAIEDAKEQLKADEEELEYLTNEIDRLEYLLKKDKGEKSDVG